MSWFPLQKVGVRKFALNMFVEDLKELGWQIHQMVSPFVFVQNGWFGMVRASKQCGLEGGIVRVTKEFVGSGKCEPVLDVPLFNERMILFYVKRLYCCNL